jgi:hypothetical protein
LPQRLFSRYIAFLIKNPGNCYANWQKTLNFVKSVETGAMKQVLCFVLLLSSAFGLSAQSFEIGALDDVYKGYIGETIKVPVTLTNHSGKPITLVIRKAGSALGGTQKNYLCPHGDCLDPVVEDYIVRLEPGQTLSDFEIALDAGLANGVSSARYEVINRHNSAETLEFNLNFAIDERSERQDIFTSPHIVLHEVYPNPIVDYAFVNYDIINEEVEAKIIIHNILGNPIDEYNLPSAENKVKIRAESIGAGIYFYTLYLDNEGVVTRKLIVKK